MKKKCECLVQTKLSVFVFVRNFLLSARSSKGFSDARCFNCSWIEGASRPPQAKCDSAETENRRGEKIKMATCLLEDFEMHFFFTHSKLIALKKISLLHFFSNYIVLQYYFITCKQIFWYSLSKKLKIGRGAYVRPVCLCTRLDGHYFVQFL